MLIEIALAAILAASEPKGSGSLNVASCSETGATVLKSFLNYELEGYRLSSKGHEAIWDLTDDAADPGAFPIVVTKSYDVLSSKQIGQNECQYQLKFDTYGVSFFEGDKGVALKKLPGSYQNAQLTVLCKETCRIELNYKKFALSPHPGKEATLAWLSKLRDIQITDTEKRRINKYLEIVSGL